ncbi:MAG: peptide deformylase [Hyphomicrobiales bacterium]
MILPITVIGHPTLKKVAQDIDKDYPNLGELIKNMYETMHHTEGIGLAAPQVNKSIRLFIIDATPYEETFKETKGFKKTFINAKIVNRTGDIVTMDEGCISIPGIREDVDREETITIQYYDENWEYHEEEYSGIIARIIQHEYDHIDGILFTDRISPLKKMLLRTKIRNISTGKTKAFYKVLLPPVKGKKRVL